MVIHLVFVENCKFSKLYQDRSVIRPDISATLRMGPHERTKCVGTRVLFDVRRRITLWLTGVVTRATCTKNNARSHGRQFLIDVFFLKRTSKIINARLELYTFKYTLTHVITKYGRIEVITTT